MTEPEIPPSASASASPPARADQVLDARGLACPLPVLRARKLLSALPEGAVLEVLATDPASAADFRAFCAQTGDRLLESREESGGLLRHWIRKAG